MTCKLIEFCLLFFFALHFSILWSFLELCFALPQIFPTPSSTGASLVVQTVKNLPAMQETWVWSLGREDPLEKWMSTHSSILPREVQGHRSLVGYSLWGHKESDMTEQLFGASPMAQQAENLPAMQETQTTWVWSLVRKIPGGSHGNPLQYSCLENSKDRGAWKAIVQGITKSHMWLSTWHIVPTTLSFLCLLYPVPVSIITMKSLISIS